MQTEKSENKKSPCYCETCYKQTEKDDLYYVNATNQYNCFDCAFYIAAASNPFEGYYSPWFN